MTFEEEFPEFGFSKEQAQRFVNKMSESPELTMMFNMWKRDRLDKQRVKDIIENCRHFEKDFSMSRDINSKQLLKELRL